MNIAETQKKCYKTAKKRGKFSNGIDRVLLDMHSEVTELSQARRKADYSMHKEMLNNMSKKDAFEFAIKNTIDEEIADVIISCFSLAEHYNIDVEKIIEIKMKYNEIR